MSNLETKSNLGSLEEQCENESIFKSAQLITCSVKLEDIEEEFLCSFVYASNLVSRFWRLESHAC